MACSHASNGVTVPPHFLTAKVLKIVSPSSKPESRAELSDVPIMNKRSSRCKGIKRGQTSQVKRTLLYEEKLPPGYPWLYSSAYDPHMDGEDMPRIVNDYTRMKLAVDLVNGKHNPKRDAIKELGVIDWNQKM
ncbi:hypothetical protein PIB30_028116 [Stylosanthes scabra]|uniref:Uncharacterized protein n=1 Tax=Stylosanthes scabra TaxID=79078 RepID=A0ABU6UCM2_9FABA|nr:hypothetical protein [Stylosanthes scabra]